MAYSNWGAILLSEKENKHLKNNCDTTYYWINNKWEKRDSEKEYPQDIFSIGGHAILFNDTIALEWHKRYFPTISVNENGIWRKLDEKELINDLIKNDKISYFDVEYHCNYDKENEKFYLDDYSFDNRVNNLELYGITLDKINYDYFDLWNITWSDGSKYHIIIGQGIGQGYENTFLTKFVKKHGWFDNDGFYFDTSLKSVNKTEYMIMKASIKDRKRNEWYWIRSYFKDSFKTLFKLKFGHSMYLFKESFKRLIELRYIIN